MASSPRDSVVRVARSMYSRLDEGDEPVLRPPTREYVESFVSQQQALRSAPAASDEAARSKAAASKANRLFNTGAAEPEDLAQYFGLLTSREEIAAKTEVLQRKARVVLWLATTQLVCALIAALLFWRQQTPGWEAKLLLGTAVLIAASASAGLMGAVLRSRWALQAFFITQMWALSFVLAQWLRTSQQKARHKTFCNDRDKAARGAVCTSGLEFTVILAIIVALAVVYVSMFYADALAEGLQDDLEETDRQAIIKFTWMMNKKTLLGINRFEDVIHAKFEELVGMGYLKPKPPPPNGSSEPRAGSLSPRAAGGGSISCGSYWRS